jgi:hypothetical protein
MLVAVSMRYDKGPEHTRRILIRFMDIVKSSQAPSFPSIRNGTRVGPLRASNEHILIVRVLRARRAPGRFLPIPSFSSMELSEQKIL